MNILICGSQVCLGTIIDLGEIVKHFKEKGHEVILHENFCKEINKSAFVSPFADAECPTVFAGCSPHVFEIRIKTMFDAPVEVANIREQCSWMYDQPENAKRRCIDIISLAVSQIEYTKPYRRLDNVLNEVLTKHESALQRIGPNPFKM